MFIDHNYTMFTPHRQKQINCELMRAKKSHKARRQFRQAFQSEYNEQKNHYTSIALYRFFLLKHPSPPPYRPPRNPFHHKHWYYQHLRALLHLYHTGLLTSHELHQLHRILKIMATIW